MSSIVFSYENNELKYKSIANLSNVNNLQSIDNLLNDKELKINDVIDALSESLNTSEINARDAIEIKKKIKQLSDKIPETGYGSKFDFLADIANRIVNSVIGVFFFNDENRDIALKEIDTKILNLIEKERIKNVLDVCYSIGEKSQSTQFALKSLIDEYDFNSLIEPIFKNLK